MILRMLSEYTDLVHMREKHDKFSELLITESSSIGRFRGEYICTEH